MTKTSNRFENSASSKEVQDWLDFCEQSKNSKPPAKCEEHWLIFLSICKYKKFLKFCKDNNLEPLEKIEALKLCMLTKDEMDYYEGFNFLKDGMYTENRKAYAKHKRVRAYRSIDKYKIKRRADSGFYYKQKELSNGSKAVSDGNGGICREDCFSGVGRS